MSKKRKELPVYTNVEITGIAAEGKAIAHIDNKVVFVPFASVGDIVDISITKKKSSFMEGKITDFVKKSPYRTEPVCPHFTVCGGCKWQHLPYDKQLEAKQQQVIDVMERIGHVAIDEYLPIFGSENVLRYRNKLEFTFSNKRWLEYSDMKANEGKEALDKKELAGLGFHIPKMFDKVLDIDNCYLGESISDEIRLFIKNYTINHYDNYPYFDLKNQEGMMRTLMIRTTSIGQTMVLIVFYTDEKEFIEKLLSEVKTKFPNITSLLYCVNKKCNDTIQDQDIYCYYGKEYIEERMGDLVFRINPKSFYQTNSIQAHNLYKVASEFAGIKQSDVVYDLYTGCGTIANFVARGAKKVIGVEYVPEAIEDAKINSKINNIDNTLFFAGDMKDVLTDEFFQEHGKADVIITDPPRAGMHQSVIETILRAKPNKIVYVSCNPATQARDLALLTQSGEFAIRRSRAVDMFPHTHHIENVVLLERL